MVAVTSKGDAMSDNLQKRTTSNRISILALGTAALLGAAALAVPSSASAFGFRGLGGFGGGHFGGGFANRSSATRSFTPANLAARSFATRSFVSHSSASHSFHNFGNRSFAPANRSHSVTGRVPSNFSTTSVFHNRFLAGLRNGGTNLLVNHDNLTGSNHVAPAGCCAAVLGPGNGGKGINPAGFVGNPTPVGTLRNGPTPVGVIGGGRDPVGIVGTPTYRGGGVPLRQVSGEPNPLIPGQIPSMLSPGSAQRQPSAPDRGTIPSSQYRQPPNGDGPPPLRNNLPYNGPNFTGARVPPSPALAISSPSRGREKDPEAAGRKR
jgi:hypothetical protein